MTYEKDVDKRILSTSSRFILYYPRSGNDLYLFPFRHIRDVGDHDARLERQ